MQSNMVTSPPPYYGLFLAWRSIHFTLFNLPLTTTVHSGGLGEDPGEENGQLILHQAGFYS